MMHSDRYSHIRLLAFSLVSVVLLAMGGCRSAKTPVSVEPEKRWTDIYVPVKLELTEPSRMSISGRATMVRDESIYLSLRMIGMEVATVYIDRDSIFATEKMNKQMLAVGFEDALGKRMTVGELQELLLGEPDAKKARLPKALTYDVERADNGNVIVNLKVTSGRKTYSGRLIWNMESAQVDTGSPRQWRRPSGYSVIDISRLPKLLESF